MKFEDAGTDVQQKEGGITNRNQGAARAISVGCFCLLPSQMHANKTII